MINWLDRDSQVVARLDSVYGAATLGDLAAKCEEIEQYIVGLITRRLISHFSSLGAKFVYGCLEFDLWGARYVLSSSRDLREREAPVFELLVANAGRSSGHMCSKRWSVDGIGYYRACQIDVAAALEDQVESVAGIVAGMFVAAYQWMESRLAQALAQLEEGFTTVLYRYMRIVLNGAGKRNLAPFVWFSVFSEKNGYYAIDRHALSEILNILKQRDYFSFDSPLYLVLTLLGLEMPFEKSFSKEAMSTYKRFSLEAAAYARDMPAIFKTEEQMTRGAQYAIFPICDIGDRRLVASFPATLEEQLKPVLVKSQPGLTAIYQNKADLMARHIGNLRRSFLIQTGQTDVAPKEGSATGRRKRMIQILSALARDSAVEVKD